MSRIIKFRAWHKEKRIMITVCALDLMRNSDNSTRQECEGYYDDNMRIRFGLHEVELMRFTGFYDIWEDDIVKVTNHASEADIFTGVVEFNRGRWEVGLLPLFNFINIGDSVEVIGNIHKNPELKKVENE